MLQKTLLAYIMLLFAGFVMGISPQTAQAVASPDVAYLCTTRAVDVRACAQWTDCGILLRYEPNTLLVVTGTVTGDREGGSDQWLVVQDPVQLVEGYVHSTYARDCEPEAWQTRPVIPEISSDRPRGLREGTGAGQNDPQVFSVVGDCQAVNAYFCPASTDPVSTISAHLDRCRRRLTILADRSIGRARRSERASRSRRRCRHCGRTPPPARAARRRSNVEDRLRNPSIVIISMETWNRVGRQPTSVYEDYLAQAVEFWMDRGVVPILSTKADNIEGDNSINAAIVRVAERYDMPLWNFWLAAQSLTGHGFDPALNDGFHLRWARSFYNNPDRLRDGWSVRNLTALQALDAVWRGVRDL